MCATSLVKINKNYKNIKQVLQNQDNTFKFHKKEANSNNHILQIIIHWMSWMNNSKELKNSRISYLTKTIDNLSTMIKAVG